MSTIRVPHRRRYTSISREALNDSRLSFRARGVLAWLLDKPDDWRIDSEVLASQGKEGRDAVRTALNELAAIGYLRRNKVQDDKGHWSTYCDLFEEPLSEAEQPPEPKTAFQPSETQPSETRTSVPQASYKRLRPKTDEKPPTTPQPSKRSSTQNQPTPTPSSSRPPEWAEWEQVFAGCGITPLSEKVWEEGYRLLGAIPSLTVISLRSVIERAKVVWPTGASANITPRSIAQNWENLNRPVDKGKGGGARSVLQTWEDRRSAFPWSDYSFEHLVTDSGERTRALRQSGYRSEEEMLAHRADSKPWPIGPDGYVIVPEGALS